MCYGDFRQPTQVRVRRYRTIFPTSRVDSSLFDNNAKNSITDLPLNRYWTSAPQNTVSFCRSIIQSKLHQIMQSVLRDEVCRRQEKDEQRTSSSSNRILKWRNFSNGMKHCYSTCSLSSSKCWEAIPENCSGTAVQRHIKHQSIHKPPWKP